MLQARGIDSKDDDVNITLKKNQNQNQKQRDTFSTGRGSDAESGDEGEYTLEKQEETVVQSSIDSSSKVEMIEMVHKKEEEKKEKKEEEKKEEEKKEEEKSSSERVRRPERIESDDGSATVWHVHPSKK